ncbi:hypothetical protein GCM10028791_32680 [Echinicola sediminis]
MTLDLSQMHSLWDQAVQDKKSPTTLPPINFNEIVSSVFAAGPFYYYILDFYDFSITHISPEFQKIHGISPENIRTIDDVLALTHPDDMDFVAKAEETAIAFVSQLGVEKFTQYKVSYNFRYTTSSGNYELFNHQALILTIDEKGNFIKSINIHTNINHLTKRNNHKISFIGLAGLPSFLNIDVYPKEEKYNEKALRHNNFSKREIEIMKMIADGIETKIIADKLFISLETVKSHRKNMLRKTGCTNSTELVARGVS